MHIGTTQLQPDGVISEKTHNPTGRVSIEQIVRLLIGELGVPERHKDWDKRLARRDKDFRDHSSWP